MNDSKQTITRYLLGELSEGEQSALEERYFTDPRVFDEVTAAESALVDDYVRGRLPHDMRQRLERSYLADARRRNRVRFAEALAARLDQSGAQPSEHRLRQPLAQELESAPGWWTWFSERWALTPALGVALATVVIVSTGIWLTIQFSQVRQESAQVDAGRDEPARTTDPERPSPGPADQSPPESRPTPAAPRASSFVTLVLAVGVGQRGQDGSPPPTLVIPPGTADVRLQLRMREHEYSSYQIVLRAIGGPEILRRANIRPVPAGSGAVFTLTVPSTRFSAGDYMLTLQGAAGENELDDLSQSLFRVDKK